MPVCASLSNSIDHTLDKVMTPLIFVGGTEARRVALERYSSIPPVCCGGVKRLEILSNAFLDTTIGYQLIE